MHRFFINKDNVSDNGITVVGDDVQHISRVLRLSEGEIITLCDGQGMDYITKILEINKHSVETAIIEKKASMGEPDINVVLYQGIPKSTKMDLIIQKCTEMGITRIVPVSTGRTVVKLETEKDEYKKVERWSKIAEEAAKQSGRGAIPIIELPMTFKKALSDAKALDLCLIPFEQEREQTIDAALKGKTIKNIGYFVGPEGGFELSEIEEAKQSGIMPVTLGQRILRTETAGFVVLTCIMYEYGQMGR